MPDQSSAATEHALLQEITAPLDTLPDDPVAVVNADFPVGLRGYDRVAVDFYVQKVSRLVAELQATRSPEAVVRRALERVGEQISGVLQRAHETAEQITAQSRREAEDRLEASRVEAAQITTAAQQRVSELDADTDRIWVERDRVIEDARELARQLSALAQTAAEQASSTAPYDNDVATQPEDDQAPPADDRSQTALLAEPEPQPASEDRPVYEHQEQLAGEHQEQPGEQAEDPPADAPPRTLPAPIPAPGQRRRSSSVIPPASQAANRRFPR